MDRDPLVRVVRGQAEPEEVAALVAVLVAGSGRGAAPPAFGGSAWARSGRPYAGARSWIDPARRLSTGR